MYVLPFLERALRGTHEMSSNEENFPYRCSILHKKMQYLQNHLIFLVKEYFHFYELSHLRENSVYLKKKKNHFEQIKLNLNLSIMSSFCCARRLI